MTENHTLIINAYIILSFKLKINSYDNNSKLYYYLF